MVKYDVAKRSANSRHLHQKTRALASVIFVNSFYNLIVYKVQTFVYNWYTFIVIIMFNFLKNGTGQLLQLFFQDPEKKLYVREISKILNKEPGHFQRALNNLVEEGILIDEKEANLRYFKLNKEHPLYFELKKIVSKTLGIEAKLKKLTEESKKIKYAFIFGSIAADKEHTTSDIDLMLIGQIDEDKLILKINKLEEELGREINYHIYNTTEFIKKRNDKNDFIVKILKDPKIILKGKINDIA